MSEADFEVPAAYRLLGVTIPDNWVVREPLGWRIDTQSGLPLRADIYGTGGNFSVGYIVEKEGRRAFLKALNLASAMHSADVLGALKSMTEAAIFEASIHAVCSQHKMDRVVLAVASGQIKIGVNLQDTVPYLILELADGDVRRRLRIVDNSFRLAWGLRALHHAATGLAQIHKRGIAHQDLKPSNLLNFGDQKAFKIGDFGRAVRQGAQPPHEDFLVAGDPTYAPPELLYGQVDPDWNSRRMGCDIYLLGSMLCFFVLGEGTTPLLMGRLAPAHRPQIWNGRWIGSYSDVLPNIRNAFTNVIDDFSSEVEERLKGELTSVLIQLCEPDPLFRGHPLARAQAFANRHDLSRFISIFDRLARKSEIIARGSVA
ncbi:protein kinase domain-containing protein [Inquilinus limosus]|uniref:Protein kinase domain-containing protein n=1 Tax=Inquilinus limosus TaxID=171674 RepID=A0A211YT74_9PROT|nr:protein kinase [Inquilinus limosus]OWJ56176.1 hypothetical protein BWR60_35275 [Inquilinus limosus]